MQPRISLITSVAPLDWQVADDYKLEDFPGERARQPRRTLMIPRGFPKRRRYTICADARTRVEIIVNGHGETKALEGAHSIFLDLANTIAESPYKNSPAACEAARAFIKQWGMLSAISPDRSLSSTVEALLARAQLFRTALTDAERNGWRLPVDKIRHLSGVTLMSGLTLQPKTLIQFCWLELFAAAASGFRFYRCGQCGKYGLLREPAGRSGPDRQYCSPAGRRSSRARAARARAAHA